MTTLAQNSWLNLVAHVEYSLVPCNLALSLSGLYTLPDLMSPVHVPSLPGGLF